ncbi:MAG: protein translocase subunit SecD [Actinomycetota bacterium]|nr:protein translocase subunit SecD [Actinomycetota bacterium]
MSNAFRWRLLAVVAVLAGAAALVATRPVRLGLDLQGGTQIVLEAQDTERQKVDGDTLSRTLEVLRRRVDALGVAEPSLQGSGNRRIIVELPGVADPKEAVEVIGRTAQLRFHPVVDVEPPAGASTTITTVNTVPPAGQGGEELVLQGEDGERLRLGPARITGEAVGSARAALGQDLGANWDVEVGFRGAGERQWVELTGAAACAPAGDPKRRVAIVLDRDVISSPEVSPEVTCGEGITGGTTVITGDFTEAEAKDLALLIRAGALPVPVQIVEQRTIGPTLGDAAIDASVQAAIIGAALTILYMISYYRLLGGLAAVGLVAYGLVCFAVLLALRATLTLPGIAGFVLAVGMAVDANVLVFERAKEEHAGGRSVRLAVVAGFRRAWSAIADSNATTLLAAVLLFFFASGAVRGFGVTLSVGVVVSMFTALVLTRVLVELAARSRWLTARPNLWGLGVGGRLRAWLGERGPNILGRSRLWFAISAAVVVLAIVGIATRGLTYGLEFSGGRLIEYSTERPADLDRLRAELAGQGLPRAVVQESGDGNVAVRTAQLTEAQAASVRGAVERVGGAATTVRDEFVGPTIGDELRRRAVIALALALAAQLVYLAVRFRWTYATAAVVAMFHDVAILLGIFAWLGKTLDGVFLAALLTVIGYSINDSVVVFDRIREQRRARRREPLAAVANDACLQTVPRTINTGLGAIFILVALYLLGGETLTDFALALIIGILVGTYSSVFTAAPLAVAIEGRTAGGASSAEPVTPSRSRPGAASAEPVAPLRPGASRPKVRGETEPDLAGRGRATDSLVATRRPVSPRPPPPASRGAPRPRKRKGKKGGRRR